MDSFVEQNFSHFLREQGIDSFDALWSLPMSLVEEGNFRGKGVQSEVSRWHHVYVKKQENYLVRYSRWFRPRAKCAREFQNLKSWAALGLPTLEPLYFHQEPRARRAILATRALDGYQPLDEWLSSTQDSALRAQVFGEVARLIARVHQLGWYHHCFFPKHVFINRANLQDLKLIDLEKARKQFRTTHRDIADLGSFFRRCQWLHPKESLGFMKAYFGVTKFENKHRLFLKKLQERSLH